MTSTLSVSRARALALAAALVIMSAPLASFADTSGAFQHGGQHGPVGHPGGGQHGPVVGHPGGHYAGRGDGHVEHSIHFEPGHEPHGGWRGHPYRYNGFSYAVWAWGPWAPYYGWAPYTGWRLGLGYYIPEGLKCFADNTQVAGEWAGHEIYYASDDAVSSALGHCENDPYVVAVGAQEFCRIRTCVRW